MNETFDCASVRVSGGQYWYGRYCGIAFKVKVHQTRKAWGGEGVWNACCGYIYLDSRMMTPEAWARISAKDDVAQHLLDHPHGGLTYFRKTLEMNPLKGEPYEMIECGWDHSHLWDYERGHVDATDVVLVAIHAIDHLRETSPDLTVWNQSDGTRTRIGDVKPTDPHFSGLAPELRQDYQHYDDMKRKHEYLASAAKEVSESLREVGSRLTHAKKMRLASRIEGCL